MDQRFYYVLSVFFGNVGVGVMTVRLFYCFGPLGICLTYSVCLMFYKSGDLKRHFCDEIVETLMSLASSKANERM